MQLFADTGDENEEEEEEEEEEDREDREDEEEKDGRGKPQAIVDSTTKADKSAKNQEREETIKEHIDHGGVDTSATPNDATLGSVEGVKGKQGADDMMALSKMKEKEHVREEDEEGKKEPQQQREGDFKHSNDDEGSMTLH